MARILAFLFSLSLLAFSPEAKADPIYGVRLLTHVHKPLTEQGLGIGGWLILPNLPATAQQPIALIGPRYDGDGWWLEVMAGARVDPNPAGGPSISAALVSSNRFQLTPKFFGKPVNVWGNLQFIDLTGDLIPYLFLMGDYVLPEGKALIGVETENYFNLPSGINDIAVGPQVVLPFGGVNIITAFQFHLDENVPNQVWVRAMYDFGPPA